MIAPWIVGATVALDYGDDLEHGTVLAARRDPHEYMPGVWVRVRWYDGFECWTHADSLDAVPVSFS